MLSQTLRGSKKATLSTLNEEEKTLEESRLQLINDINRIDDRLTQIQAERLKIANDLCPLLNLPTEVTCMIFAILAASHRLEELETGKNTVLPEVAISHVCKRWRDVSLNYPRLWTRFLFRARNVKFMRNPINQLDTYIKRSGSLCLELFLHCWERREWNPDLATLARRKDQITLLDMAIKQVKRWRFVELLPSVDLDIETRFAELKSTSAPNLEYLVYLPASPYITGLSRSIAATVLQGGAPKLRYLLFDSSTVPIPPLSNITTLLIETTYINRSNVIFSWKTLLEILLMPSLVNLSVVGNAFLRPEVYSSRLINMTNLKHLRYTHQEYMTFLLPFLRAPLLETLSISNDEEMADIVPQANPFGIPEESYFFPSLQTLILINPSPSFLETPLHVMQITKNVSNILTSHSKFGDFFFPYLEASGVFNNESCWPKLISVTAEYDDEWDQFDSFVHFVLFRPKDTLKLRLFNETNINIKTWFPDKYEEIQGNCTVEVLETEEENVLKRPSWPPGLERPVYAFTFD